MNASRVAPVVGVVGCLAVLVALVVPYLTTEAGAAGTYYATGAINPLIGGLFAAVAVVVSAAGRAGRTDPATAAGVALVFGIVVALVSLVWALTVPEAVVFQLSTDSALEYHRWVLALCSLMIPVSGAWYARGLGLV